MSISLPDAHGPARGRPRHHRNAEERTPTGRTRRRSTARRRQGPPTEAAASETTELKRNGGGGRRRRQMPAQHNTPPGELPLAGAGLWTTLTLSRVPSAPQDHPASRLAHRLLLERSTSPQVATAT